MLFYSKYKMIKLQLEEGFTRDVRNIGHFGTGDLEIAIRNEEDLTKAEPLILRSYVGVSFPILNTSERLKEQKTSLISVKTSTIRSGTRKMKKVLLLIHTNCSLPSTLKISRITKPVKSSSLMAAAP